MRGKGAVLIGLLALARPALAQQPSVEPEDQQPERPVRRSMYSIYGPYYVLDENGEPTGEVREGMGRMDESWGPSSYGSYGGGYGAYGSYGYANGWGGWDRGWSYGYSGRTYRAGWRWSAADGRWVRNSRPAPRPAPSRP